MRLKRTISITLFIMACLTTDAATRDIMVKHLCTEEGLSHYTVNAIHQDEFGFIWIGTMDGLNRYDGQKTRIFRPEPEDSLSIMENNIRQICGDGKGHLYIKGLNSISEFDMRTSSFRMLKNNNVRHIYHDGEKLWIAGTHSLSTYNRNIGKFDTVFKLSSADIKNTVIDCFIVTRNGDMCICTSTSGFYQIDSTGKSIRHIETGAVNSVHEDRNGNILIATRTEGLTIIGNDGKIKRYTHDPNERNTLTNDNVRQICEDLNGNYWMSTYGGLCKLDPINETFTQYRYDLYHKAYNIRSITSIMCDSQGTLWFGSFYEGVSCYNPEADSYIYHKPETGSKEKLNSQVTSSFAEDSRGDLWIGTEGGGVGHLQLKSRKFRIFDKEDGLSSNVIKSIIYDNETHSLYIAHLYDGLDRIDTKSGKITRYGTDIHDRPGKTIENIVKMKFIGKDSILLATNNGLIVFNQKTGIKTSLKTGFSRNYRAQVWDMETDSLDNLWFTTSSDLYRHDIKNNKTYSYPFKKIASSDINNNLNYILKDSKGRLWFGSSGSGVFLYDRTSDSFSNVIPAKEMGNGYVTGLQENTINGCIYIATNRGVTKYNHDTAELCTYGSANGFPLSRINENSLFITSSGELFASDMNGMISIPCDNMSTKPKMYNVYISGLYIDNRYILAPTSPSHKNKSILKEDILFQNSLTVHPGHSSIGFEISNTDYLNNSSGLQVEYMMKGFDTDFIKTTGTDHITYTNLNPGNYTFIVRGTSVTPDGTVPSSMIDIKVLPPFYKTVWFILLCNLIVLSIIIYLVKTYTTSVRLRALLNSEKREKAYINQVNQDKLRFFTNISHEFRTPLTLIDGQLELLLQRSDLKPTVYSKVLNIYRNSQRMRRLVDELIDIRKQEAGKMKLKISENDMTAFLKEIYVSFEEHARHKNIDFTLNVPDKAAIMLFDPVQMEKVFFNLLSNAFKFTMKGGEISMTADYTESDVTIKVTDNGVGISPDVLPHIFERFVQDEKLNAKLSYYGSGVGLSLTKTIVEMHGGTISVESDPGKQTCFKVSLSRNHLFSENVIRVDNKNESMKSIEEYIRDFSPEEHTGSVTSKKSARILIVEDNDSVRDMLHQIFEPLYDVSLACCGEEGIEKAKKENPDIILSDVMMPGISGFEMCSKLKNDLETSHIPIVLLTAKTAENQILEGLQTGADDYVTKPFHVKILVARCNNLVDGRRRLQQKYLKQPDATASMLTENPKEQAILEKAVSIVMKHIDDDSFNIDAFSQEMGLSRTYLFSKIKGLTGQSPNKFISSIRLKQAIVKLKENPDANMVDIAYSLGFSSQSYFIKCFKAVYGKTPSQYVKDLSGK